jgi:hypothetical protein
MTMWRGGYGDGGADAGSVSSDEPLGRWMIRLACSRALVDVFDKSSKTAYLVPLLQPAVHLIL